MENHNTHDKLYGRFIWRIEDFSIIGCDYRFSKKFAMFDHIWSIVIYPQWNDDLDYLGIFLDAAGNSGHLPRGWSKFLDFKITLIDQVDCEKNLTYETSHLFNEINHECGFQEFILLDELYDLTNGSIVSDTCKLEVEILVKKSNHHNGVDQSLSNIEDKSVEIVDKSLSKDIISSSFGELADFRGLGKVEQAFVPLLEELCSRHLSLIDSMQKRSQRFIEWAFTALGRVLHFLKTKKVRDMDDDAYNHLQLLWEELDTFRFDLMWLEPHVKSALGMKTCVERAVRLKMLRENLAALKMETKRLKIQMIDAEVDLKIASKDFHERKRML